MAYSTKEESAVRPIGRYPVPNKKDMPYDIVELMEEVERKVMDFCCKTVSGKGPKPEQVTCPKRAALVWWGLTQT